MHKTHPGMHRAFSMLMGSVLTAALTLISAQAQTTPASPDPQTTTPYQQQPGSTENMPAPEHSPAPEVTPETPTPDRPFTAMPAYQGTGPMSSRLREEALGSAYIPLDSWIYPAMMRLNGMGYLDSMYLAMRPYTRQSALHILQRSENDILSSDDEEAQTIFATLLNELSDEGVTKQGLNSSTRGTVYGLHSAYTRVMGVSGSILQDSFHLGQTYFNDYGRPHEPGFNNYTGFSGIAERGRFSFYVRAEYQHAPGSTGYPLSLGSQLDQQLLIIPYAPPNYPDPTIPTPIIAAQNPFRIVEANLSGYLAGHEISIGKSDAWLGPGMGSAMAWSNNAENIYSFRINRVEPLTIPFVSKLLGPVRYDFFYGSLKGHTAPNHPYVHSEMFSFAPTRDFQFAFQRTIVFGGAGHEPVTLHTFLKGFFSVNDTNSSLKFSRDDPGARFSDFSFSYRLPLARKYLTLYTDSETHDDVTPISAPRRAGYRPGIYLSHFPGVSRMDFRLEAANTDCATHVCENGNNEYTETIQKQAYTNKGNILGDWIGREGKGGQAWLTYHLTGNEWVQLEYLHKKTSKDFIAGGVTQNQFRVEVVKRLRPDIELNAWYQRETWKAPIYKTGSQGNNTFNFQLTIFPKLKTTTR
ncbi:MAG TPA: capsule assembly Wzi family protein [Acidobacteriaceae bacterium]|nr:capsule assembly Wzi family protein [Acidobacteriaceae bacterium]